MAKTMENISLAEAVADAKAVINGATVNAKLALEEALTPRIKSILYTKLAEDLEEETEESIDEELTNEVEFTDEDETVDDFETNEVDEDDMDEEVNLEDILKELELEEEQVEEETDETVDEELDEEEFEVDELLEFLKDTKLYEWVPGEKTSSTKTSVFDYLKFEKKNNDKDEVVDEEIEIDLDEDDDEVNLDDLVNEYNKEKESKIKKEYIAKIAKMNKSLNEANKKIAHSERKLKETNLFNAKLLYANKLLQEHSLTKEEKTKLLSKIDKAKNVTEVKLVFEVLNENYSSNKQNIQESFKGFASNPISSTVSKNSNTILNESTAERFKKLANII